MIPFDKIFLSTDAVLSLLMVNTVFSPSLKGEPLKEGWMR